MIHSELLTAVYTYFQNIANIPDVVYPNVHGKCKNEKYMTVNVMPYPAVKIGISSGVSFGGIIQVSVFVRDGVGEIEAAELVDMVVAAFPLGAVLEYGETKVRIDEMPSVGGGIQVGNGHYMIPISIEYNKTCS